LARDHHERATTPQRARSEGPVTRPPPPARPPAPRLPLQTALAAPASSSSSSSSSSSQPLLPPTPSLRQQPPPPQPTSSSSSSSATGAKSGNVQNNQKSWDSNSSVLFLVCSDRNGSSYAGLEFSRYDFATHLSTSFSLYCLLSIRSRH